MHIAYFHYLYGDATGLNHVRQFTRAARDLGHRVDVHAMNLASPSHGRPATRSYRRRLRAALKSRFRRYLHDPKEFLWNVAYYRREAAILRAERPDVVLVRAETQAVHHVPLARKLGLPLVVEMNSPAIERRLYEQDYLHLHPLHEWATALKLRHADAVVVVSSALRDYLLERHGLSRTHFTVAPNGADSELFHPEGDADPEFPRDPDRPRAGFIGSFQRFHGVDLLSAMIERVGDAFPPARFLLVGDGPAAASLTGRARGEQVQRIGRVPHARVPRLVASMDIGVMPASNFYGSPLKVLEWMSAGLAVVAPRHGPLEEILRHGEEGLLFAPGDLDALCAAVLELMRDPEARARMGARAAARVRGCFTWKHNAERVVGACSEAIERRRSRSGA